MDTDTTTPPPPPRPVTSLRPIVRVYVILLAVAAISVTATLARSAEFTSGTHLTLALILTGGIILAFLSPINAGHQISLTLEFIPLIPLILLFDPGIAALTAGLGSLLAHAVRRHLPWVDWRLRDDFWPAAVFNAASLTLQTAAAGLAIAAIGWDVDDAAFDLPLPLLAVAVAGVVIFAVERVLLAGVISFFNRARLLTVLYDLTLGKQPAEQWQFLAQLGVGLLAAVIAHAQPWALALLLLPSVTVYAALRQHIAMRRRAETNLAAAQRIAALGSLDWDLRRKDGQDQRWSPELYHLLGLDPQTATATAESYLAVVHPADRPAVATALRRAAAEGAPYSLDHRITRADGAERIIHSRAEIDQDRNGRPLRVIGTLHDITDRKHLEDQLAHQAFHDPLTDLPNRAFFTRQLDEAFAQSRGVPPAIAVLFLDLDRFKLINDTMGHEAGDQLLISVAARLRDSVRRPDDVVARLGGDEFTILLGDVRGDAEAEWVARRIITAMTGAITLLGNREIVVSTSIGIVRPAPEHHSGADLLRDADNALYRAKEGGRNQFAFFDASMRAATAERVALEADLRHVLERGELRVLYQPKVDLLTRRPVAVEAFLRWAHPERGWVSPLTFIPIAEETGLIAEIGAWTLATACREAATWTAVTTNPPVLSVNLSGKQLHDPDLSRHLTTLLRNTGLEPRRLRLEVAETVAMKNPEATIGALSRLRAIGVRVVIDDFGTGFSSLASLRRFPVDNLQLDASFVADLDRDPDAVKIASAVIGLAHGLGLPVMAEGIERPEQLAHLLALGCEQGQGNFFAVPQEAPALAAYLERAAPYSLPFPGDDPIAHQTPLAMH